MIEQDKASPVGFWCDHIDQYRKDADKWLARSRKIVKRYKDERPDGRAGKSQFNILWSNVQTLSPALYDRNPVPNIDRRFQNNDKLGTVSAQVLERCVSFYTEADEFGDIMRQVVLDRLLAGRGTAWIRYEPEFRDIPASADAQISDDAQPEMQQELVKENVVLDFVHFEDFGHTFAKTWQEVRAVWRSVQMSRKELVARFGEEIGNAVPMDSGKKDDNTPDDYKRATVYEIWDKEQKKVIWVNKGYESALDERNDPLKLENFFPCPKPIYATIANDRLIPTPDYVQYQDQAKELDDLTGRINNLVKALRVAGVYDASAPKISQLVEGEDNVLIPVDQWAIFGEKGGLKGVMDFLPMKDIIDVLLGLYQARDKTKQDLYEVTGISDIVRGSTNPNETLGAQELKGKYAGLRMGAMQADVVRFCRDIVRIFAEIIAEQFSPETIIQLSGFELMTQEQKMMAQMDTQNGLPLDEEKQEALSSPSWEEVFALMKDQTARKFRISIETDSTIKVDQEAEKQARTEFLTATAGFIQQAAQVQDPNLHPILMEMLKFGIKGFKVGREMETVFDVASNKMKQAKEQPPQALPDPDAAQRESDGQKIALESEKMKQDGSLKTLEIQSNNQIEMTRLQYDEKCKLAELDIKNKELILKEREIILDEQRFLLEKDRLLLDSRTQDIDLIKYQTTGE